ncbi:unnamed protein product [Rotaria sordida]|uniref:Protein kinase domain-containing protein n=1 Tax=Rotaria sordida TaxID=392033 RepID=A0A819P1S2_9BILA|nr:unnamed protein product [Rotaria sordida]
MATNDGEEETLQKSIEKLHHEEEKTKQVIKQLRDEIEKIKREAEEIELIERTKHQDEIEKMEHEAQDMQQIELAIHQYKFKESERQIKTTKHEREIYERINETLDRQLAIIKRRNELKIQIEEAKQQQIHESYQNKKRKLDIESDSSSNKRRPNVFTSHDYFFDIDVPDDLQSFDINVVLNDNNYFNDNILNYIKHYSDQFSSYPKLNEEEIQKEFDQLIINLLNTLNNSTSLKYLNTSSYDLENQSYPCCTFIYKNINIDIDQEESCLQDFVVCLGNLISPYVSLSENSMIEEILLYLKIILLKQHREKIYGFLSNYTHIKFFYVKKESDSDSYEFFQSQELEMFIYSSEVLSSIDMSTTTENTRKLSVNKDTWKIFINFLTMNIDFYQYKRLNIDPNDDLLGNRYMITKKLGYGATSIVYLLEKKKDNHSAEDSSHYVIKILTRNERSECFLNEVKITKKLKRFKDSNNFHLFFQNILDQPSSIKYLLYEKQLQCIQSLSLIQAKQLIDIVHYLYDCRIIHCDVRPQNLMLDRDTNHIKLIDFGFAFAFDTDNKGGSIHVIGPLAFASEPFLNLYSRLLKGQDFPYYFYERTFDLICTLNIIMAMSNADINRSINSFIYLQDVNEVVFKSLELWKDTQRTNKHYSKLLKLIEKLDSWYPFDESNESNEPDESNESSVSHVSNDQSAESDQSSISNVSQGQSDKSAIFDILKDKIEKLFDV